MKLIKSGYDRKIAGVCGGLAQYFGIDSLWVRIGFVVGTLFTGIGAAVLPIAYLVAWLTLPDEY